MSDWQVKTLHEVTEKIFSGGTPSTQKEEFWNGNISWLSSGETGNRFIWQTDNLISKLGVENSSTKLALKSDVVIASAGQGKTRGQTSFLEIDTYINQSVIALRADGINIIPLWLFYNLSSRYSEMRQLSDSHSIRGSLTTSLLKLVKIKFPDIEEQKKRVGVLYSLDQKIQLNTQTNQTLEAIAQAIFKSWFVDFDPVRAKAQAILDGKTSDEANLSAMAVISGKAIEELSQTEYQELWEIADAFPSELVENAEFGEVPKGWEVRKIESIIKKIPTGKKYSQKTVQETGKVPVLDQGKSGLIGFHNDEAGVKASIENPVIVFANHTCYMRLISYDFSAIQNVFAFRGNELDIYWVYLATLGKQEFTEYKGHFPDFLIKEIIVPTTELTTLFGNFIKYQFMNIFENDKQNKILADLRDLLLPKLLSGEIEL